ncbi:hypothetical protein TDB9533_00379 [Thalassocella blandensis]|nr:hypothetical protein TDB9533_00379 [Thalassocella blandensis]
MSIVSDQTSSVSRSKLPVAIVFHRVALSLFGSYAFTWGFTAFGVAALSALGVDFHEAETAMLILAFLVILAVFLWAFAARSLSLVWLVLAGGAALFCAAAWGIQKIILA